MPKTRLFLAAQLILLFFGLMACGEGQATPTIPPGSVVLVTTLAATATPILVPTSAPLPSPTNSPANTLSATATSAATAKSTPTLIIAPTFTPERVRTPVTVAAVAPTVSPTALPVVAAPTVRPTAPLVSVVFTATEKLEAEEQSFILQLNEYRRQNGVGQLTLDNNLIKSARWMAQDLAGLNTITHTDSLGRDIYKRIKAFGYPGRWVGENIAGGFERATDNLKIWQSDDIHKNNLLGANYTKAGIGRYYRKESFNRWFWVLDLG